MREDTTRRLAAPPAWAGAQLRLRQAVAHWIARSVARQRGLPWQGGHDEGSFVASWFGYYLLAGDPAILDFLRWLRGGFLEWARAHLFHGYYAEGEVHHQPENFIFFLPRLWHADPDPQVAHALEDAAHHAGNWIDAVPPWYDWRHHRLRSWRLGTREVAAHPPHDIEHPDHFRIIQIALCAYHAVGDERYLELARDFCLRWARGVLRRNALPAVRLLTRAGASNLYPPRVLDAANAAPEERLELHIGAGTVDTLLDLFAITAEPELGAAARKIVASGLHLVGQPYSQPLAAAARRYRIATGDDTLDADILTRVPAADGDFESAMLLAPPRGPHPMGLGQRRDQVRWMRLDRGGQWQPDERPSPAALVLAWDISGDERLATEAMMVAAQRMELATALDDGREHGCAARSASAIASGHGRNAGIGEVTGVLYPLALGSCRQFGADRPQVMMSCPQQGGLPQGCAAVWRHCQPPRVRIYNGSEEPVRLMLQFSPLRGGANAAARELELAPGELAECGTEGA
jgi:hypothetical protein